MTDTGLTRWVQGDNRGSSGTVAVARVCDPRNVHRPVAALSTRFNQRSSERGAFKTGLRPLRFLPQLLPSCVMLLLQHEHVSAGTRRPEQGKYSQLNWKQNQNKRIETGFSSRKRVKTAPTLSHFSRATVLKPITNKGEPCCQQDHLKTFQVPSQRPHLTQRVKLDLLNVSVGPDLTDILYYITYIQLLTWATPHITTSVVCFALVFIFIKHFYLSASVFPLCSCNTGISPQSVL